jgi:hypothetical protein
MKTMTCNQLGGACDIHFHAETFEEMGELAKKHGMEMAEKGDEAHLDVMKKMKEMQNTPGVAEEWMENKKREFEALPEDTTVHDHD